MKCQVAFHEIRDLLKITHPASDRRKKFLKELELNKLRPYQRQWVRVFSGSAHFKGAVTVFQVEPN